MSPLATEAETPRVTIFIPTERQVLAELFTSMLVLSASFKYRPAPGCANFLYWVDGDWSLSLIEPDAWSDERRAGFVGTCALQPDMTWTLSPSAQLADSTPLQFVQARCNPWSMQAIPTSDPEASKPTAAPSPT